MLDLKPVFMSLEPPPTSETLVSVFSAAVVAGHERFRIARDRDNRALLLISVPTAADRSAAAPFALEHLHVEQARECRIRHHNGDVEDGLFTIIACQSTDVVLRDHFLLVAGFFAEMLGRTPEPAAVTQAIQTLVELFRAMQQPPRKAVQGLWAEVFVLAESRDPEVLARSWHVLPEDRYDFGNGPDRVEVKSVAGSRRIHQFSLSQLSPPEGSTVLVASVLIERLGGGVSLDELLTIVRRRLGAHPDLILRVDLTVATTLGRLLRSALRERFDLEGARSSLAFFDVTQIPSVVGPIPREVTDIRFRSDLTALRGVNPHCFQAGSPLYAALPLGEPPPCTA